VHEQLLAIVVHRSPARSPIFLRLNRIRALDSDSGQFHFIAYPLLTRRKMKLTKKTIDAIKPDGTDRVLWDPELRGFGFWVKPGGLKSFVIQFRNRQGQSRRVTVGQYGRLTPDEARREARRLLADVERGLDPAEQLEERSAITVSDLCREYLAKAEAGLIIGRKGLPKKASTLEIDRGRIARHIIPLLGKKPIKDLASSDVRRFLDAVTTGKTAGLVKTKPRGLARVTGGATAATRAVGLLGGMLTYAREVGYIEHNPAHGIRKPADKRRSFRLAPEGYRTLGHAIEAAERRGEHWQATAAIRMIAVTGCRRSEILHLKWSEVDLANSCLRLGDTKTGASIRPLPKAAQAILRRIKPNAEHVFPDVTRGEKSYASVFPKVWRRIVGQAYTPHGLRHAYASAAHELGLGELTIKALLGHARLGVTSGYIATVDNLVLAAAEKVACYVEGAITSETGKLLKLPMTKMREHA
jgi:integrase